MTVVGSPPSLDYHEALAALAERGRFGVRMGLGRSRALLAALGDPHLEVRGALVAGTNGKGSVLALAASALRAAGLRVGETPKPHLVTYRERIVVDGHPIAASDLGRHVAAALQAADAVAGRHGEPTEFELLTAVVFRHFAESRLDVALVEVGLGGRLDATHVWDGGVAVVTNVALDHTEYLGTTIAAIAREKAAIIERGDRAVTGASGAALPVIERRAARMGAPLTVATTPTVVDLDRDGITVDLPRLGPTRVGLRGRHQAANVAVADAVLDALEAADIASVDDTDRRRGYASVTWPGRLELVELPGRGSVLLDGAHNPAGALSLAGALDDLAPFVVPDGTPMTVVTASMVDKDVEGVVDALATSRTLLGATIIATSLPGVARAMPAGELATVWRQRAAMVREVVSIDDPIAATERAIGTERTSGLTVVAGSLYLVGAVRAHLVDDPELRDPEPA